MLILVDESGTFARSAKRHSLSVVAALVVPEGVWPRILSKYSRLRRSLPKSAAGEVKGSLLSEAQFEAVASVLRRSGVLAFAVVVDSSVYTEDDFLAHRQGFADSLIRGLPPDANPILIENVHAHAASVLAMNEQLYTQAQTMLRLAKSVVAFSIPYYSLRQPKALGAFDWTIDAKDLVITDWETLWRSLAAPLLQTFSINDPLGLPEGGDFRYLSRFFMETPDYLEPHFPEHVTSRRGINLTKIFFDSFRFSSETEPGLELADLLANGIRRALVGHLQPSGWEQFAAMMIPREGFQLVKLGNGASVNSLPYIQQAQKFYLGGRVMLTPGYRRQVND